MAYKQTLIEQLKEQRNRLLPIAGQFPRMVVATDDERATKGHIYAGILDCVDLIDEWLDVLDPDWRENNPLEKPRDAVTRDIAVDWATPRLGRTVISLLTQVDEVMPLPDFAKRTSSTGCTCEHNGEPPAQHDEDCPYWLPF